MSVPPSPPHEEPRLLDPEVDLEARLLADVGVGQPVAILPWHRGLVAVSADGQRQQMLATGPIEFAMVDHRARVIWFGKRSGSTTTALDELWLVDLATPTSTASLTPVPVRIATGLPPGFDLEVVYPATASSTVAEGLHLGWRPDVVRVSITFDTTGPVPATLGVRAPYRGDVDEMDIESSELRQSARLVPDGEGLLRALAQRTTGRRALLAQADEAGPDERRVVAVADDRCHNEGVCGTMRRVAGTKLVLVTVQQWCPGYEGCELRMQLFDPERGLFLALRKAGATSRTLIEDDVDIGMETLWVSADGRALVREGTIVVPGVSWLEEPRDENTDHDPRGGGWLGAQWAAGVQLW